MYTNTRNHYTVQAVETAGPAQLVLMMYDGALAAITRAEQATDPETVNRALIKAQDIVTELQLTLDQERGGAIAVSLSSLYAYCLDRLIDANLRKDRSGLDDVRRIIADLRDAWAEACCTAAVASSA